MIAFLDAAYSESAAGAACVIATDPRAPTPTRQVTIRQGAPIPYEPGSFYKRELPLLLAVLRKAAQIPELVVIDGYAWLDANGSPGLGAHLHEALGKSHTIIGVGKTAYRGAETWCAQVCRGTTARPLFVTTIGMTSKAAAALVRGLHGDHRIPTLIRRTDSLAREALGTDQTRARTYSNSSLGAPLK
jgi:deoxyribonuclease V